MLVHSEHIDCNNVIVNAVTDNTLL